MGDGEHDEDENEEAGEDDDQEDDSDEEEHDEADEADEDDMNGVFEDMVGQEGYDLDIADSRSEYPPDDEDGSVSEDEGTHGEDAPSSKDSDTESSKQAQVMGDDTPMLNHEVDGTSTPTSRSPDSESAPNTDTADTDDHQAALMERSKGFGIEKPSNLIHWDDERGCLVHTHTGEPVPAPPGGWVSDDDDEL